MPTTERWSSLLTGPRSGRLTLAIAALLAFPLCFTGIFVDDYFQQLALERQAWMPISPWDLFTFAWGDAERMRPIIENGPYPWWTLPELKFSFLRPLTCVLANVDLVLFGRNFFFHHLHSLGWYLGLVSVVTLVFRRALGPASPLAALAALLFALDDSHAVIVGWIANRNALVATVPALIGLMAHIRWREQGARGGLVVSLLGCAVGLAGGEAALGAIAYLVAYELTIGRGRWSERLRALVPLAVLGVAYIVLYRSTGSGAYGSEVYVDPIREPLRFLAQAPAKALTLIGAQFLASTADLWLILPQARPVLISVGLAGLVLMTALLRRLWPRLTDTDRQGLRWLTLGAVLSTVPVLATFPLNRLLLMPSVGGSALLATVLWHGWKSEERALKWGARVLTLTTVLIGLLGWPIVAWGINLGGNEQTRAALETKLSDEALGGHVLVFVAPDPTASMYVPMVRTWNHKPTAKSWNTLSFAPFAHRLTRVDARTVDLEVVEGRMLESIFEQLMRASHLRVAVGYRVRLAIGEVTVLELNEGLPSKVRLRFDDDPDAGTLTLAQWVDGELVPLKLPKVGEGHEFPRMHGALTL